MDASSVVQAVVVNSPGEGYTMDASSVVQAVVIQVEEVNSPGEGAIEEGHTMDASLPVKQSAVAEFEKVDLLGEKELKIFLFLEGFLFVVTSLITLLAFVIGEGVGFYAAVAFGCHIAVQRNIV